MAKRTTTSKATSHTKRGFAELLSRDPELSALRAELEKSVQLAPAGYDLPANNLERLRQLRQKAQQQGR